ncbi:serine hydrolase domain-containing protein [Kitasatospora sp. NPDC049285]|uniref:serine hydrolase domain-containing protein n=1 Tax=Kitasatospora sp. NPDC049285 TaxID=3157096 RepID=UPI003416682E
MTEHRTVRRTALRLAAALLAGTSVLAFAPVAGAATATTTTRTDRAALQHGLDALTTEGGAVGAVAELRDHGRVAWRGGSGLRALDSTDPAPLDGEFRAGSVNKTFVATVLLQLTAEGRVRLDDPLERYLPGAYPGGDTITVRQVMSHTAGIYDYTEDPQFAHETEDDVRRILDTGRWITHTPDELIAVAARHAPYFPPGQGWHYSNTDYLLIGKLVDAVTGHSWRTEVERRILRPLGLRHTYLPGTATAIPGPHSHGYLPLSTGPADVTEINPSMAGASGELISTTDDLARFQAALFGGRLLAPAQLAELTTTVPGDEFPPTRYGLGTEQLRLSCTTVWGHSGGILGYASFVFGTRDGTRQLALSATPYDPAKGAVFYPAVVSLIDHAFCG